jgi:hypothetical protein
MGFGCLALAKASDAPRHAAVIEKILGHCTKESIPIAHLGSFTTQPQVRKDDHYKALTRSLLKALLVFAHNEIGSRFIAACVTRFKVDDLVIYLGGHPLHDVEGELPAFHTSYIVNGPVRMMYLKTFSEESKRHAENWRVLWDQRLVLPSESEGLILPFNKAA